MKHTTRTRLFILLTLIGTSAFGSGMLIPKEGTIPPMAIKHQRVTIDIKDGVATAKIEQVFKNSVNRDLEAVYIFPLPADAAIGDFAMYINGKRMSGELVEKEKARTIYQDIVRRMKDPGLLEHIGGRLFRVSVYPVKAMGEQKIELEYSQTLPFESGLYQYTYPLKTGDTASRTLDDFTLSARILSALPIKNIYSPSHTIGISRKNENSATIGFEQEQALLDKDFVLYYSVSKKEFGLNLLSHAVKGKDGFFMLMLSPMVVPDKSTRIQKDVTFVLDTSGSMSGKKMKQAGKALEYCVQKLNTGDRFNIVRFSTDVESFKESLVSADKENITEALTFISGLEARGGTDINSALKMALEMHKDDSRPGIIAFLTDGRPTIGESDTDTIVSEIKKRNTVNTRVFVFGVGETVNTHLLDRISNQNGGMSQYVKPDEDIEVKLSSFSDKMSNPVLSNPQISVDALNIRQLHPRSLPDLFAGEQITLFGRYKEQGHVAIHLTGTVNGENREFVYEGTFHKENSENEFIPRLWATRRVGYLLDEIRLNGESDEIKNEVLALSREYGIMTPYTSYLVLENEDAYKTHGIPRGPKEESRDASTSRIPAPKMVPASAPGRWAYSAAGTKGRGSLRADNRVEAPGQTVPLFDASAETFVSSTIATDSSGKKKQNIVAGEKADVAKFFERNTGAEAITMSEAIQRYQKSRQSEDSIATVRHIGTRLFLFIQGRWVDSNYKKEMPTSTVTFASDAYFKLLTEHPELKKCFALGQKVTIVLDGNKAIMIE